MTKDNLYETLKTEFLKILADENLLTEKIEIISKALTPEEAIGITKRKDFPIITGKEIMIQAEYRGAKGQAFTDSPAVFKGTLAEICNMDMEKDPQAAGLFIASLNAVMKYLGKAECTVHCKSEGPEKCAKDVLAFLKDKYENPKIALVGYQPSMLENLSKEFNLRVLDLNPSNIGTIRYGVKVEDGISAYEEVVKDWADLVLCTGSTICNGTIVNFMGLSKPVLFFGTTLSGAAPILGLNRLCFADCYN
ncbi:MAG: hypothetical protein LIR50_14600 [Bacillota bacterium]|nr:hypothetical protein [Bacillota bacterium]